MRWDAKIVFIKVDFPSPVWPAHDVSFNIWVGGAVYHTNTNHVELETTFEKFALNLGCDTVETDMAFGHHWPLLRRHWGHWSHGGRHSGHISTSIC